VVTNEVKATAAASDVNRKVVPVEFLRSSITRLKHLTASFKLAPTRKGRRLSRRRSCAIRSSKETACAFVVFA
jgi:hypothetical protein